MAEGDIKHIAENICQKSLLYCFDLPSSFSLSYLSLLSPYFSAPVLGGVGGLICRVCNLAVPFHGCLLDLGTCQTKPAQYCKKVVHIKGGIEWYSVKGCTKNITECFERTNKLHELVSTHCCHRPLCNF
ncbi:uncharacterized protein C9orf57 homolog [Trachypithecus francoisi]|uniref:uncharacterized protein C9orf57 homolog n=1 Tax=Trachypithecus francoisi TaxID=54180 RepID=UPI00141B9C6E|nr:uncharacterized protein C9orf57 homolog [Trachypithecus francoisi]